MTALAVKVLVGCCKRKQVFHKRKGAALNALQAKLKESGRLLQEHAIFDQNQVKKIGSVRERASFVQSLQRSQGKISVQHVGGCAVSSVRVIFVGRQKLVGACSGLLESVKHRFRVLGVQPDQALRQKQVNFGQQFLQGLAVKGQVLLGAVFCSGGF